jgi:hypothetical protein
MRDAAIAYARRGLPIFPVWTVLQHANRYVCACGRGDCQNRGKHPLGSIVRNGVSDATADIEQVKHWWMLKPDANIGLGLDGLIVVDVDPRLGGDRSLVELEAKHGPLPKTRRARTGGGGEHIYFRLPAGLVVKNDNRGGLGAGLDIKAKGGYVLAPPSLHESGNRYAWIADVPAVEPPAWLIALITKAGNGNGKGKSVEQWHETLTSTIHDGTRDCTMASIAGKLLHYGIDVQLVHDLLACVNIARCAPPLPDARVGRILRSVVQTHVKNHGESQ